MRIALFALAASIAAVFAVSAEAQQTDLAPSTVAPPVVSGPPPPSDAPDIDMLAFCNRRDVREHPHYYPSHALDLHLSGGAVIDCAFGDDGKPASCQIVEEAPARYGFGEASLRIMCSVRLTELSAGASPDLTVYQRDGETRARKNIRFRLSGG